MSHSFFLVPLLLAKLAICEGQFDCDAVAECLTTENTQNCFGESGRDECLARPHTFTLTVNSLRVDTKSNRDGKYNFNI